MKINLRIVIIIIFSIAFFTTLYFLITNIYSESQLNDREQLRPREGISIGHNDNMRIDGIEMHIVNTRDTDSITVRIDSTFLNSENNGTIGIYFPYNIKIKTNDSGFERAEFESDSTAFLKKYSCNEKEYCKTNYFEEYVFELIPEKSKFDSKNGYNHGIKIKIDHVIPNEVDEFFREYDMKKNPLRMSFDDSVKRQLTIIIPENADSIHPIPIPDADIFHNRGIDYSNTQLDWHIMKESQAFFVDYEMPEERKQAEMVKTNITLTGIIIGVIVGLFGIALAIESTKKKSTMRDVEY